MRFRILGPLEVQTADGWVPIGAAKWRAVLARLLLSGGQIVSTDTLIHELWGDNPQARAPNLVSIYVLRLRRFIGDHDGRVLKTRSPGYELVLGRDDLDTQRFGILMSDGREALTVGDPRRAAGVLADSLALWRGKALADIPLSTFIEAEAERLDELRFATLELRIEADIATGRHRDVIPELRRLLADQQLREELWLLLIRALDGAGRRGRGAGRVRPGPPGHIRPAASTPAARCSNCSVSCLPPDHQRAAGDGAAANRRRTAQQTTPCRAAGRPSRRPRRAMRALLTRAMTPPGRPPPMPRPGARPLSRPQPPQRPDHRRRPGRPGSIALGIVETGVAASDTVQASPPAEPGPMPLPADITDFTGRELHVSQLCGLLSARRAGDDPERQVCTGRPGRRTSRCWARPPWRSMRRTGCAPTTRTASCTWTCSAPVHSRSRQATYWPGSCVISSEDRVADPGQRGGTGGAVPDAAQREADARAAQCARCGPGTATAAGSASCAVIVTSRSRLSNLVGGRLVHLDVLDDSEALALFSRIVGTDRAAAEPDATAELLVACAGLPLAIRICAASGWPPVTAGRSAGWDPDPATGAAGSTR